MMAAEGSYGTDTDAGTAMLDPPQTARPPPKAAYGEIRDAA